MMEVPLMIIDRGVFLTLIGKAVAIAYGGQFEGVNPGNQLRNFMLNTGILWILGRGLQEHIQRAIEFFLRLVQEPGLIQLLTLLKSHFRLNDGEANLIYGRLFER